MDVEFGKAIVFNLSDVGTPFLSEDAMDIDP